MSYIYDYYAPTACANGPNLPGHLYVIAPANYNDKCFSYNDPAGRLTDVGANLANGSAFICSRFRYDYTTNGLFPAPGTINNAVGHLVEAETDDCTAWPPTKVTDEWFSYDAKGNLTDVWQSTPHSG